MILNKITVAMVAAIFSVSLGVCSEKDVVEFENKCVDTNSQKELMVLPLPCQSDLIVISEPVFTINSIFNCNEFIDIMQANYADFVPMIFVFKDFFKFLDMKIDFKSISAIYNSCNKKNVLLEAIRKRKI